MKEAGTLESGSTLPEPSSALRWWGPTALVTITCLNRRPPAAGWLPRPAPAGSSPETIPFCPARTPGMGLGWGPVGIRRETSRQSSSDHFGQHLTSVGGSEADVGGSGYVVTADDTVESVVSGLRMKLQERVPSTRVHSDVVGRAGAVGVPSTAAPTAAFFVPAAHPLTCGSSCRLGNPDKVQGKIKVRLVLRGSRGSQNPR
jgi:hypothetical protein